LTLLQKYLTCKKIVYSRKNMKLLLIEDEIEVAGFLTRGLKYEGFLVDHLDDGISVLEQLKNTHYDAIILDLMLPTVSGQKVLQEIRFYKIDIPVLVLTALDDAESKAKVLDLGADDYLTKPFSFVELVARIKSIIRRSNGVFKGDNILEVGDLVINNDTREVKRKGQTIKLRLKEYVLLEYFMQNPDKVINRNAIIENVWDYNSHFFSNTVNSHISILRKKLNQGFDKKLIETVHGFGYVLKSKKD